MIQWLKNLWLRFRYIHNGPKILPDWFIRHRVRCQECNKECDIVHIAPVNFATADSFYCQTHEPSSILDGWERRVIKECKEGEE